MGNTPFWKYFKWKIRRPTHDLGNIGGWKHRAPEVSPDSQRYARCPFSPLVNFDSSESKSQCQLVPSWEDKGSWWAGGSLFTYLHSLGLALTKSRRLNSYSVQVNASEPLRGAHSAWPASCLLLSLMDKLHKWESLQGLCKQCHQILNHTTFPGVTTANRWKPEPQKCLRNK